MTSALITRFDAETDADFTKLPEILTELQYLQPHQPVEVAMKKAAIRLDLSPEIVGKLISKAGIAPAQAIGRLTRKQLNLLAEPAESALSYA